MTQTELTLPARSIPVRGEYEVVVAGGGAAGVAAAVSAARAGARTLLVERMGFLGGTMTSISLGGICGLYSLVEGEPVQMVFGFAEEVRERLARAGGTTGPLPWLKTASLPYDLWTLKTVLEDLAGLPGLDVLLHARLLEVAADNGQASALVLRGRRDTWAVRARVFVDCTGDGELAALAGAPFEYNPAQLQYPTTMFRMGGVNTDVSRRIRREDIKPILERAVADGYPLPRTSGGIYSVRDGIVHLNITRIEMPDGTPPDLFEGDQLTHAEMEGRRQAQLYLEVFRRYVPGYERAFILDAGAELGVRESRRVLGDLVLDTDDVVGERKFDDAVAANCWPIEDHVADRSTRWVWLSPGGYNHIPYRALLPRGLENVLVAGRCLSSSHDAQASLRVTANCFSMGQAAGVAAALAASGNGRTRDVPLAALQARLQIAGVQLNPGAGGAKAAAAE